MLRKHTVLWLLTLEPVQPNRAYGYCSKGVITRSTRIAFQPLTPAISNCFDVLQVLLSALG